MRLSPSASEKSVPVYSRLSSRKHPWRCPLPLLIAGSGLSVCGLALPPRSVNQPTCFRCGSLVLTTCTLQSRRPVDGAGCMRSGAPSAEAGRANSIRCFSRVRLLGFYNPRVLLLSPLPIAARARCVWPWASLATPSIGIQRWSWGISVTPRLSAARRPVEWGTYARIADPNIGWA